MRAVRYVKLFGVQVRMSLLLGLQYRYDFLIEGLLSLFWIGTALVPLFVIFGDRPQIAGWSFGEALLVVGWFTLLQGVLEGAINPSLSSVVEHIRKGTLDFVLLKPADAQFLVSTAKFLPWRVTSVLGSIVIFAVAFAQIGRAPGMVDLLTAALLFVTSVVLLYSLWILTVCAAFYVVKVDNLTWLFSSVFDAARWPSSVFPGGLRIVFTFVLPLALMTTFPSRAMLGQLSLGEVGLPLVGAAVFFMLSRAIWLRSIGRYTSASS